MIDTGAEISLIKYESLNENAKRRIRDPTIAIITGISDAEIRPIGTLSTMLHSMPITFYVIKEKDANLNSDALIGMTTLRWCAIDFPNRKLCFKHKSGTGNQEVINLEFEKEKYVINKVTSNDDDDYKKSFEELFKDIIENCEDILYDPNYKQTKRKEASIFKVYEMWREVSQMGNQYMTETEKGWQINDAMEDISESKKYLNQEEDEEYSEDEYELNKFTIDIVNETELEESSKVNNFLQVNKVTEPDEKQEAEKEYNVEECKVSFLKQDTKKYIVERKLFIENELNKHKDWTLEHFETLSSICKEFNDIFHLPEDKLSFCKGVRHQIITKEGTTPISLRNHRLAPHAKQIINETVHKLLEQDIIQPSTSPWNAPLLVVPKKPGPDGKKNWRVVVDYRKLNASTRQDAYPLPRIEDILDQLGEAQFYTSMDLESGYYQILMDEEDKEKTAFSTPYGHFEFNKMPFGLTNGPATFQRMMNHTLSGLHGIECLVYLDDIVVYGKSLEEHNLRLRHVFERLRKNNLKVKISKCQFLKEEILFLGHKINRNGLSPDPTKVEAVLNFPPPSSIKKLQSFLGLANYYRKFIDNFAHIAEPLNKLLRSDEKYRWTTECQNAFEKLKLALTTPPVLIYPDYSKEFILTTDASNFAIGAVLSQGIVGQDQPIAYVSRSLDSTERKYATIEKEMLAIVYAVKYFRCYLQNRKFTIYTDHKPLTGALRAHDTTSRLTNLLNRLVDFDYIIKYKPGRLNLNADALSRLPYEDIQNPIISVVTRSKAKLKNVVEKDEDNSIKPIAKKPCLIEQKRYSDAVEILDPDKKQTILQEFHLNVLGGHQGRDQTFDKISRQYKWKGLFTDVDNFVKNCEDCQRSKVGLSTKMPLGISDTPYHPFEKVFLDVVGPLSTTLSGNKYILTFEDDFSKTMDCVPVPDQEARTIAEAFVERIICRYSLPEKLITDKGTNFESHLFKEVCKVLKIKKISTTSYHPQSNGSLERCHRPLADYLRIFEKKYPDSWDTFLAPAMFVKNTSIHSSTKFTPTELLMGFNPKIPTSFKLKPEPVYNYENYAKIIKYKLQEAYKVSRENVLAAKHRAKEYYDKSCRERNFKIGDFIRIKNPAKKGKLDFNWSEPYKIIEVNSNNNVTVKIGNKNVRLHNNRIKLAN